MNWKISKIEVSSFKAFKKILLDLNQSSLLTLDGPNGYGKTSIFDAIELLLTGQIKRIDNLFSKVMTKSKKNYEDNLFWNKRAGENDLIIKIEFFNNERTLTLARYASVASLKEKALNRADSYSQFKLYELPDFSSDDFSLNNLRENSYIETLFGNNFRENFCFLNYLEQGQNQLLLTKVDERKDALGNLFNITDIVKEIDNCKVVERSINKYLRNDLRKNKERELISYCQTLKNIAEEAFGVVEYKKLSTSEYQPEWDKEILFPTYSAEFFTKYIEAAQKVLDIFPLKNAIENRIYNDRFEAFITNNMESLRSLALFGNDISKLSELDKIKTELDVLTNVKDILLRGAAVISLGEVKSLPLWDLEQKKLFEDQIIIRNNIQQKSNTNSSIVAELCRLKAQILEEHLKLYPDDSTCPLCGADWKQHQNMLDAVSIRIQKITNSMGQDEKNLINLITKLNDKLIPINSYMNNRVAELKGNYNKFLHIALVREKSRFENLEKITKRLNAIGTSIDYSFNQNEEIIDARLQALISSIRSKKLVETETLPEDWKQIIYSSFKVVEDFYILNQQDFIDKVLYIKLKANEARNKDLAKSALLLREIQKENQAAQNVGLKIKNLRETLEKVERTYAEHTISEIELIFHIYSGRLIQNYQRGLGLFIESRDGKQLRFLTAEKSEHDAILSMSSGQVSALSLAFFLSLNKVYARVPIILIDDPSQSLDEVNIASLTDLLRGELKHRQLIVSSHEGDISAYMRYRFKMAGLSSCSLNMQRLAKESGNNY